MNRKTLAILAACSLFSLATTADVNFHADSTFGSAMPESGDAISLKQAIAQLEAGEMTGDVKVAGQVTEVCQAKGCWMILVDGDSYARVTFKDYGFFVPIETSMQQSLVYGQISELHLSEDQAHHFDEDAGAKSTLKLDGATKEYSIVASSVQLQNPE